MRIVAVGVQPVGVVAIGLNATGVVAVGELATGVVAVGQLARGVVVFGQLAFGFVSIGQLAIGVVWACGQVGIAATSGPGMVLGLFGRLYARRLLGGEPDPAWAGRHLLSRAQLVAGPVVVLLLAAAWWFAVGAPLVDSLTRPQDVVVEDHPPDRCIGPC